ncbi:MAG: 4Fe-4S dicluster domain-containing protein [Rhodopirellula sp.]|nr:4Fe-4S dicluster domain-containing protein [Rhodopirellula sp.]
MLFDLRVMQDDSSCGKSAGGNCQGGCACGSATAVDKAGIDSVSAITSRRGFLRQAGTITFGAMTLTLLTGLKPEDDDPNAAGATAAENDAIADDASSTTLDSQPLFGFLVDTSRCIGSGKCLTACRTENDVPEGYSRTWVERFIHFKDGTVQVDRVPETGYVASDQAAIDEDNIERAYFVPKLCNHCVDAPCNQVCPVHAAFKSPEGVELVDADRCIGCAYCVQACPYGARFINPDTGVADKCTWCYHRIMHEELPACVEACPVNARIFGRLDDPDSEISKRIASIPTSVLKPHLGTHPTLRYIGNSQEVI